MCSGNLALADLDEFFRAAQHAGRGAADLDVGLLAHRLELEHRVESRDFQHADIGHVEQIGDGLADRRLAHPAVMLLLRAPQQRDDRGGLTAFRIAILISFFAQARLSAVNAKLSGCSAASLRTAMVSSFKA
jgi:hypothetical protein